MSKGGLRRYRDIPGLITAAEARRKYMDPRLIDRVSGRMDRDVIADAILHHVEAMRFLLDHHYTVYATGNYCGPRVSKMILAGMANELHDFWNLSDMHKTAGPGAPEIWEE